MHIPITINPSPRRTKTRENKVNTGILLKRPIISSTRQGKRTKQTSLPFNSSLEPAFLELFANNK